LSVKEIQKTTHLFLGRMKSLNVNNEVDKKEKNYLSMIQLIFNFLHLGSRDSILIKKSLDDQQLNFKKIKNMRNNILLFLISVFILSGCSSSDPRYKTKPKAYSKINEVSIVMDEPLWEGEIGDSLRYYFSSPYLILPSPEPIFDLRYFTPKQISEEHLYRSLRNYIVVANLADETSPTTNLIKKDLGEEKVNAALGGKTVNSSIGKNKWANGQHVFYLYSNSGDGIFETIRKSYPALRNKLEEIEKPRIKATAYQGGNIGLIQNRVLEKFGAQIEIPKGYVIAIEEDDFMWIRRETKDVSSSILMTKVKYDDPKQLTEKGIEKLRNTMGQYVTSEEPNSYMITNNEDLPLFTKTISIADQYAIETHGIWELENDFKGGPFVNMAVVNKEKGELFMADGFVFAPGEKKRNHMQYLDEIMSSIRF